MGSDSISNAPLPVFSKEFGKKKRTNRLAKLKQSKLDVRREQWLSQVKNKVCKVDSNDRRESTSPSQIDNKPSRHLDSMGKSHVVENKILGIQDSNAKSLVNDSFERAIDHDDSEKSPSGSSSSSSIRSYYCSESASEEEEEEEDGCLDDWEAVADALNVDDNQLSQISNSSVESETRNVLAEIEQSNKFFGVGITTTDMNTIVSATHVSRRAWTSGDAFRPQTLPSLSKQNSFSQNSNWCCGLETKTQSITTQTPSCPICYEELDLTDSSFVPCSCGFRLCLFCHQRIYEGDGRCPGCRKQYDPSSLSMGIKGTLHQK